MVIKYVVVLEKCLGVCLFYCSMCGVMLIEIGLLYYEKCLLIVCEMEEVDNLVVL